MRPTIHAGSGVGVRKYLSGAKRFKVFCAGCAALGIAYVGATMMEAPTGDWVAGVFGVCGLAALCNAVRGVEVF